MPNRMSTRTRLPDHAKVTIAMTAVTIARNARAAVAIAVISPDMSADMAGSVLLRPLDTRKPGQRVTGRGRNQMEGQAWERPPARGRWSWRCRRRAGSGPRVAHDASPSRLTPAQVALALTSMRAAWSSPLCNSNTA